MPELEEGNLWIRGTFPLNASLERVADDGAEARAIMASYPEVEIGRRQIGRPDDGTDPTGFYNVEYLRPAQAAQGMAQGHPEDTAGGAGSGAIRAADQGRADRAR